MTEVGMVKQQAMPKSGILEQQAMPGGWDDGAAGWKEGADANAGMSCTNRDSTKFVGPHL